MTQTKKTTKPAVTKPGSYTNIYQKLLHIQTVVNGLAKDKKSFSYSYVTGDKVLGVVKPLMNELKLILKQEVISIENTRQDYATKDGSKSEILSKVTMKFTWVCADTQQKDENLFGANGQNGWDKGVGSALTYGERYFLLKYFHIATDEDDIDNPDLKADPTPSPQPKQVDELPLSERVNAMQRREPSAPPQLMTGPSDPISATIAAEITAAISLPALTAIYNKNQALHTNANFTAALASRKIALKAMQQTAAA